MISISNIGFDPFHHSKFRLFGRAPSVSTFLEQAMRVLDKDGRFKYIDT